ncbi:hypothetical protein SAMN05444166_3558 [Singulisphaera sp. GP187]|nr:hypothetical protein SAMN05444166_3558 [Singulisphaera sp. GP187]
MLVAHVDSHLVDLKLGDAPFEHPRFMIPHGADRFAEIDGMTTHGKALSLF